MEKRVNWRCAIAVLAALLLPAFSVHAISEGAIEGQVVEELGNKPVADAMVIALWKGKGVGASARNTCLHAEITVTDNDGHYRLPEWRRPARIGGVTDVVPVVIVYRAGFSQVENANGTAVRLKRGTAEKRERLVYLKQLRDETGCPNSRASERQLLPFRRAMLEELRDFADVTNDRETIEAFVFDVELLEFGREAAEKRQKERLRGK